MSGGGFVMGVEILWGNVWAQLGLVMGNWDVLNHLIKLGFNNKVVQLWVLSH